MIGATQPAANAEEKVVLTSPFTEAIAKVRDSVVGVNNYMKKQETDKPITTKEIKSAIKTSQQSKA